jgi:uncharacterized DUF497 family protein
MPKDEWDENKNKSNQQKHSISFEKAKEVFEDQNAVEFRGNSSTEFRILRIVHKTAQSGQRNSAQSEQLKKG